MDVVSLLHLCKLLSMCKKAQAVLVAWAITHETTPYKWIVVSEESDSLCFTQQSIGQECSAR